MPQNSKASGLLPPNLLKRRLCEAVDARDRDLAADDNWT